MVVIRVVGGPVAKQERLAIDVDPQTTAYGDMFAMIQVAWDRRPAQSSGNRQAQTLLSIDATNYTLIELEDATDANGKPTVRPLGPLPLSSTLAQYPLRFPAILLKESTALTTRRSSVSFEPNAVKVRVIGGPILGSDRIYVEDDTARRSTVPLASDILERIAAQLPGSVDPPVVVEHYELWEVENVGGGATSAAGQLVPVRELKPFDPVKLNTLQCPLLLLKLKQRLAQSEGLQSSLQRGVSISSRQSMDCASVRSPMSVSISPEKMAPSSIGVEDSVPLVSSTGGRSEVLGSAVSPSRQGSSFFRSVANAVLGARRASTIFDGDVSPHVPSVYAPAAITKVAAANPAPTTAPVPAPMEVPPFLQQVTFTLDVHFFAPSDTIDDDSRLGEPSRSLCEVASVAVVVTPFMPLSSIADIARSQLPTTRRDMAQQTVFAALTGDDTTRRGAWFTSQEALHSVFAIKNQHDALDLANPPGCKMEQTPMTLSMKQPALFVLCTALTDGSITESDAPLLASLSHNRFDAFANDGVTNVTSPDEAADKGRKSSFLLRSAPHESPLIGEAMQLYAAHCDALSHAWMVRAHRVLTRCALRGGHTSLSTVAQMARQVFDKTLIEPDVSASIGSAALKARLRRVVETLSQYAPSTITVPPAAAVDQWYRPEKTQWDAVRDVCGVLTSYQRGVADLLHLECHVEPAARAGGIGMWEVVERQALQASILKRTEQRCYDDILSACLSGLEAVHRAAVESACWSVLLDAHADYSIRSHCWEEAVSWQSLSIAAVSSEEVSLRLSIETSAETTQLSMEAAFARSMAFMQEEYFVRRTSAAHFGQEAAARTALINAWHYEWHYYVTYFHQFVGRKVLLGRSDAWWGALALLREAANCMDVLQHASVAPFYVEAWRAYVALFEAQECHNRDVLRHASSDGYMAILQQFDQWIADRDTLRNQLERMELSKSERVARHTVLERQTMDSKTLYGVISDSLHHHWAQHMERVAVGSKEQRKRALWYRINDDIRGIWWELRSAMVLQSSESRSIVHDELTRFVVLDHLASEIAGRIAVLREEDNVRADIAKLHMHVVWHRVRAMGLFATNSHRVLLTDAEERGRMELEQQALGAYERWAHWVALIKGEMVWRSLLQVDEEASVATLRLLAAEIHHRRDCMHQRASLQRALFETFDAIKFEMNIHQTHKGASPAVRQLIVEGPRDLMPPDHTSISITIPATHHRETCASILRQLRALPIFAGNDAILSPSVALCVPNDRTASSQLLHPTDVVDHHVAVLRLTHTPSVPHQLGCDRSGTTPRATPAVDYDVPPALVAPQQVVALVPHTRTSIAGPVVGQSSKPAGGAVRRGSKAPHNAPSAAVPPKEAAKPERIRSPPRKAPLPDVVRRQSTMPMASLRPIEPPTLQPTLFLFRIFGIGKKPVEVKLQPTDSFVVLLAHLHNANQCTSITSFDQCLLYPAVLLNGKVTPTGPPLHATHTVQGKGVFGGALLLLKKQLPRTPPPYATTPRCQSDAVECIEEVPPEPHHNEWDVLVDDGEGAEWDDGLHDIDHVPLDDSSVADTNMGATSDASPRSVFTEPADNVAPVDLQALATDAPDTSLTHPQTTEALTDVSSHHPADRSLDTHSVARPYAGASEASDSLVSLPVLSSSRPPFEFDRPVTPVLDDVPMYGEEGFPRFGDAVEVPEWTALRAHHLVSATMAPPGQHVADELERLHPDGPSTQQCTSNPNTDDDLYHGESEIDCGETQDACRAIVAPEVKLLSRQHDVVQEQVEVLSMTTIELPPRLEVPRALLSPSTTSSDNAATPPPPQQPATHQVCSIVGGPIPSDAPLTIRVRFGATLGDLFDAAAEEIEAAPWPHPTSQRLAVTHEHYLFAEMLVVAGKPPVLKQRALTTPVAQCTGRLFALKATPKAKMVQQIKPEASASVTQVEAGDAFAEASQPLAMPENFAVDTHPVASTSMRDPPRSVSPDPHTPAELSFKVPLPPPQPTLAVPQAPDTVPLLVVANGVSVTIPNCSTHSTLFDAVNSVASALEALHVHDLMTRFVAVDGCALYATDGPLRTLDFHDPVRRLCRVKCPTNVCVLQLQAKATSIAMDEPLLDLSDLPNCVVAVDSEDPRIAAPSLILRPAIDITVRGLIRMIAEKVTAASNGSTPHEQAPLLCRTYRILFSVYNGLNNVLVATHCKHAHVEGTSGRIEPIGHCELSMDDLDMTLMHLLQLSTHKPSYVAVSFERRLPQEAVVQPPAVVLPARHTEPPPKPKGFFERIRNAILGPSSPLKPPEGDVLVVTANRDATATTENREDAIGFEYGRPGEAEDPAPPPRSEPVSIRVLGGPIFATTKIIVTMAATELVSSIYAHARNRLIELGHVDEALRVARDKYDVFYVRRQLEQRPKAEKEPLVLERRLDESLMDRGSHVVMLKAVKDTTEGLAIGTASSTREPLVEASPPPAEPPRRVRIVGGPIPKTSRVFIDLPPLNVTYAHWVPLIDAATQAAVPMAPRITEEMFTFSELDVAQGGSGSIRRIVPLEHSFDSSPLQSLVIALKKRPVVPSLPSVDIDGFDARMSPSNASQYPLGDRDLMTPPQDVLTNSFTKSVSWSDQSPTRDPNTGKFQRLRVRVIGVGIPGAVKVYVDLVGWMTFGAVFRLAAEQLIEHGLQVPLHFDEDHFNMSSMVLDSTKVLIPDAVISPLDEVRSALTVKVLMVSPIDGSAQANLTAAEGPSHNALCELASPSLRAVSGTAGSGGTATSREILVRIVGIPGLPQSCKVVVRTTMSTSFRSLYGIINAAVEEAYASYSEALAERGAPPCPRPPTVDEDHFALAEMEVHANGQHRRKQTLEPNSTPFLSEFGATMSCIQVERRRNPLSGSIEIDVVDAFTPKRTKERQRRSSLESPDPSSLASGSPNLWDTRLRLTRGVEESMRRSPSPLAPLDEAGLDAPTMSSVPLSSDIPLMASPPLAAMVRKADPFDVDVDWQTLNGPPARPPTNWDDESPAVDSMQLPVPLVAALPETIAPSPPSTVSPTADGVPPAALAALPLSAPMELAGDDSEYEDMGVEDSDDESEGPVTHPTTTAVAATDTTMADDEAAAMIRKMMHESPASDFPLPFDGPPDVVSTPPRSSASPKEGFDEDVEEDVVGVDAFLAHGHDHRGSSSSSPKHFHGQHRSTVGSPWGSFRKRLADNIDRASDASPRKAVAGDTDAVRVDALQVVDALPPIPIKTRSSAALLAEASNDDAEREAILAFGDMLHRKPSLAEGRQKQRSTVKHPLIGLEDLDEQRQALLKIERELSEPLPHVKHVGAVRAPVVVAGATRKNSSIKAPPQPQRSHSIEPKRRKESTQLGAPSGIPKASASLNTVYGPNTNAVFNVGPLPPWIPTDHSDVHDWMQSLDTMSSDPPPSPPPAKAAYHLPPVVTQGRDRAPAVASQHGHHSIQDGRRSSSLLGGIDVPDPQDRLATLLGLPQHQHKLSFVESLRGPTKQSR